jgi:hypothetical protein
MRRMIGFILVAVLLGGCAVYAEHPSHMADRLQRVSWSLQPRWSSLLPIPGDGTPAGMGVGAITANHTTREESRQEAPARHMRPGPSSCLLPGR